MATGDDVKTVLNTIFSGLSLQDATIKVAINAALRAAWPQIKVHTRKDDAGTFSSGTFDYSLSAVTDISEWGIARVYANETDTPNVPLSQWRQYQDSSGYWHLVFKDSVVSAYNGKTFDIVYERRVAEITALTGTLEAPQAYVEAYAQWWLAVYGVFAQSTIDKDRYAELIPAWEERWKEELQRNTVLPLPRRPVSKLLREPVTPTGDWGDDTGD